MLAKFAVCNNLWHVATVVWFALFLVKLSTLYNLAMVSSLFFYGGNNNNIGLFTWKAQHMSSYWCYLLMKQLDLKTDLDKLEKSHKISYQDDEGKIAVDGIWEKHQSPHVLSLVATCKVRLILNKFCLRPIILMWKLCTYKRIYMKIGL